MMTPSVLAVQGPGKSSGHIQGRPTGGTNGPIPLDLPGRSPVGRRPRESRLTTQTAPRHAPTFRSPTITIVRNYEGQTGHLRAGTLGCRHRHACAFVGAREARIKRGTGKTPARSFQPIESDTAQPSRDRSTAAPQPHHLTSRNRPRPYSLDNDPTRNAQKKTLAT